MEVWRGTQEGLSAVIVNPGVILGTSPDKEGSGAIINLASRGIPFYPTGGMGVVDVQDVVKAMILLMDSSIKNEQFILVADTISYRDLLTKLAPYFGKKPPEKKLPKWILDFYSSLEWFFSKLFGTKRKLVKATVRSMFKQSFYDASKIKNRIGFNFIPIEETLERVAKNHLKNNED
jgi:nucleoside-diphosphate-sugar epimerase